MIEPLSGVIVFNDGGPRYGSIINPSLLAVVDTLPASSTACTKK